MKYRTDFVTNSSSSSFIINVKDKTKNNNVMEEKKMAFELTLAKSGKLENMPEERKKEILAIKDGIRFDHESISTYSQETTRKLTEFSSRILETAKVKDSPEVEGMILDLMGELSTLDGETLSTKKPSFLSKLFRTNELKTFVMKYESVASVISEVRNKLEQAEYQLRKDIKVSETYLENNKEYIMELDKYILAAKLRLEEEHAELDAIKLNLDTSDMLAVQEVAMRESELGNFERKVHNMEIQRTIAIQNIPQLLILKQGDAVLVEKIDDSINSAIPLWESQMVIAINTMRQQAGVKIQKSVTDTTNKLLVQNSEALKQSAIGVATELERDIVDIDTLKKSNENLIETLKEIKNIRAKGIQERNQTIAELKNIQSRLNQAMIESQTGG